MGEERGADWGKEWEGDGCGEDVKGWPGVEGVGPRLRMSPYLNSDLV